MRISLSKGLRRSAAAAFLGAAVLGLSAPAARAQQTTPIELVAPGPHILVEVHNVQLIGSGGAAPTLMFDMYLSASAAYVNYINNNGPTFGLQNVDVAFDVDLGTDGSTTISNPATVANVTVVPTSTMISTASGTNSLAGGNPAGFESKFKFNLARLSAVSAPLTTTPTKVATATVVLPLGTVFGTVNPGGANIRLRSSGLATLIGQSQYGTTSIAGVGLQGSKWSDFNGNTANIIGPSANATGVQPLPVTLLAFGAKKASDGQRVQLDWSTATETNSDYFEVERSATEGGTYASIGVKVKGQGTATTEHDYQSYDRSPLAGVNWYRLKIVGLDGKWGYSDARSVRFDGGAENVSLYPNPLTRSNVSGVHLQVTAGADQSVSYTIVDGLGKLVGGGSVEVSKGTGAYPVEGLESLSAGTYYLNAKGATINASLKFTKSE